MLRGLYGLNSALDYSGVILMGWRAKNISIFLMAGDFCRKCEGALRVVVANGLKSSFPGTPLPLFSKFHDRFLNLSRQALQFLPGLGVDLKGRMIFGKSQDRLLGFLDDNRRQPHETEPQRLNLDLFHFLGQDVVLNQF